MLFTLLLTGVALAFRARLAAKLDDQLQEELNADWGAMKGYMRIEPVLDFGNKICAAWYYDADDPDETTIVLDTRKIYLVADQFGNPIPDSVTHEPSVSTGYDDIGVDKPADIRKKVLEAQASPKPKIFWEDRKTSSGEPVRVRGGIVYSEGHGAPYYVAIGASYSDNVKTLRSYTWVFAAVIPGALLLGSLLGYYMAGRALTPVLAIAQTAWRISGQPQPANSRARATTNSYLASRSIDDRAARPTSSRCASSRPTCRTSCAPPSLPFEDNSK